MTIKTQQQGLNASTILSLWRTRLTWHNTAFRAKLQQPGESLTKSARATTYSRHHLAYIGRNTVMHDGQDTVSIRHRLTQ